MIHFIDYTILKLIHEFALMTGNRFTPFIRFISYLCDSHALFPIVWISIILICIKKTRKVGTAMLIAMLINFLFTNLGLKIIVGRLRPYQSGNVDYYNWWKYVGGLAMREYSFPSGHVSTTMAAMGAVFFYTNKKYSWLAFLLVILMGFSRNYLVVHYPTDVLGGAIIGFISALIARILINRYYNLYISDNYIEQK